MNIFYFFCITHLDCPTKRISRICCNPNVKTTKYTNHILPQYTKYIKHNLKIYDSVHEYLCTRVCSGLHITEPLQKRCF